MRHISILGMSFCGSTLLGQVLGALPGVAHVGESHWIKTPALPNADPLKCTACGENCDRLTRNFFDEMMADSSDWFPRIASRLGTENLVSSDKNPDLVRSLDPSLNLCAILLFRFPIDCLQSYELNANLPPEDGPKLRAMHYYWFWTNFHGHVLYNFANRGRFVVMNYDAFVLDPARQLERLCIKLQLPFTESALEYWKTPQHSLGGNGAVVKALESKDLGRLRIRPRNSPISREQAIQYSQHPTVVHMYSHLDRIARSGELDRT